MVTRGAAAGTATALSGNLRPAATSAAGPGEPATAQAARQGEDDEATVGAESDSATCRPLPHRSRLPWYRLAKWPRRVRLPGSLPQRAADAARGAHVQKPL